jgi:NAD(P)H-dependent flavin oxidoreductase YrpB (nitropropane dioxygenase family)
MLRTKICEMFGIDYPIISAGMGAAALSALAAAVSEAGGLGTIALAGFTQEGIHNEISAARARTRKPLAANLIVPFMRADQIRAVAALRLAAATFFWGDPGEHADTIALMYEGGLKVLWQCGSVEEACNAKRVGVDAIIAQGCEAGGHVRGEVSTFVLIPEVRDAIEDTPLIAAGGIADGRGLAAALALGADGVWIGTRFLDSVEAAAHPKYKQHVIEAVATDTICGTLFDREWPDAPIRTLRTKVVEEWERAGRPPKGKRPGEGQLIGRSSRTDIEFGPEFFKYGGIPPADFVEGDIESFPLAAGQSVSLVRALVPAGEIVRQIATEASELIEKRLTPLSS